MARGICAHVALATWCFWLCLSCAAILARAQDIPTPPPVVYPPGTQFYTRQTILIYRPFVQRYWYVGIILLVIGVFLLYSLLIITGCLHFRWLEQKRARRVLRSGSDSSVYDTELSTVAPSTSPSNDEESSSDEEQDVSSIGHASLFSISRNVSDCDDDDNSSTCSLDGYRRAGSSLYSRKSSHGFSSPNEDKEGRFGVLN